MNEYELLDKVRELQDKKWEWRDKIENIIKVLFMITGIIFTIFFILLYKIRQNKKDYVAYVIVVDARSTWWQIL